jgi:hypothetical protein
MHKVIIAFLCNLRKHNQVLEQAMKWVGGKWSNPQVGSKNTAGWVGLNWLMEFLGWVGLKEFVALGEVEFGLDFSPLAGLVVPLVEI